MDKILKINDIEYIQKAEYDKAKKDLDNVKTIVSTSIANLTGYIDVGVFSGFIKEYLSSANDIEIEQKNIDVQNNPQKRKEAGIYS